MTRILVTGAAGFIGAFLCKRILESTSATIVGFDNLNEFYDPIIKHDRLRMLHSHNDKTNRFEFIKGDLTDSKALESLFSSNRFDYVVNLAAQAGVRYSIDNPRAYIDSNLIGFFNVLEACRKYPVKHLVYASSSSVYGSNKKVPYSVEDISDSPVSLYAATKKSNELMANAYSHLYGIPCTGLRFFTVYGPMGRPDMAYFKFANKIVNGEPIQIYNYGNMYRDFTYIDDIVTGIMCLLPKVPEPKQDGTMHTIFNIGNNSPIKLLTFVETLEKILIEEGVASTVTEHELLPMQPGDVYQTYADIDALTKTCNFQPNTPLEDGLREFAKWYKDYFNNA